MHEPTMTRISGSDIAASGWQPATDRVDAPRPDAARSEAAQPEPPLAAPAGQPADGARAPASRETDRSATFARSYARFAINSETQRLSIKIVDAATDEVIREIPPEQVQRIADDLQSLARRETVGKQPDGGGGIESITGGGVDRYV